MMNLYSLLIFSFSIAFSFCADLLLYCNVFTVSYDLIFLNRFLCALYVMIWIYKLILIRDHLGT